jgi:hypothetical protein
MLRFIRPDARKMLLPAGRLGLAETRWPLDEVNASASLLGNNI